MPLPAIIMSGFGSGVAAGNLGMVWLVAVGCMFLATLMLDLGGGLVLDHVITQAPYQPYLRLAMWWAFFSGLSLCPFCLLRVREQSVTFVIVSTAGFILGTGLNIWAVLAGQGVAGVLWMQVLSSAAVGTVLTVWYLRQASFVVHGRSFLQAIRFSVPLVPSAVLEVMGHRADRVFLDRWASLADIGLYTLANQVGQAVKFFYDSVKPAWVPFYVRVSGERADSRSFLGTMVTLYVAGLLLAAVAVSCFAADVVQWMSRDGRYLGALPLIPIMIGVFFLHGTRPHRIDGDLGGRTDELAACHSTAACGWSDRGQLVLTQRWGATGAAWALLLSSGLFSAMYLVAGHYPIRLSSSGGAWGRCCWGAPSVTVGVMQTSHIGIKVALFCCF